MIDLMNNSLATIKTSSRKPTYVADGYMACLLHRVKNRSVLQLYIDRSETINLDDVIWHQKKVKEKAVLLFVGLSEGQITNAVLKRGLSVLQSEGFLTTGRYGNLFKALMSDGYTEKTAIAQANQVTTLFMLCGMVTKMPDRRLLPNPASKVLEKAAQCCN